LKLITADFRLPDDADPKRIGAMRERIRQLLLDETIQWTTQVPIMELYILWMEADRFLGNKMNWDGSIVTSE
jgi:hypothetical protein